jgi:hypothetical protein
MKQLCKEDFFIEVLSSKEIISSGKEINVHKDNDNFIPSLYW